MASFSLPRSKEYADPVSLISMCDYLPESGARVIGESLYFKA